MKVLTLLILGLHASFALAEDQEASWPQHRGNAGSTGVSVDSSLKPPLRMVWSYRCDSDTSGDAGSGLTVAGGKVFCNMEMTDSILALDAESGAFRWEYHNPYVHYQQTSSYADGKLFVWLRGVGRSILVALDAGTGKTLWEKEVGSTKGVLARRSGPAIVDGKILLALCDGEAPPAVVCLETSDGKELWRTTFDLKDGDRIVAPSCVSGKVFTGTSVAFRREVKNRVHGVAYALDLETGRVVWRNPNVVPTRPPVSDGEVVVVKFNGEPAMPKGQQKLWVLDARTGKEMWSVPIWIVYGTTTITRDKIIIKNYGAHMIAHDRKTGKKLWESRYAGGSGCSSPSISGDYAFVGTGSFNDSEGIWAWRFSEPPHQQRGKEGVVWSLHAVDLKTGQSTWHCVTGNNVCGDPAIAYGKLYVNSRDGRIYCFAPVKEGEKAHLDTIDNSPNADPDTVQQLLKQQLHPPREGKDWPTEGATPLRAGIPNLKITPPLTEAWTLNAGGRIISSAVASAGKVYVGSLSGKLVCADLQTGKPLWQFQTGGQITASPAVADGMLYCGSDDGIMYALDAANGTRIWQFKCGGPVRCSPAVAGGVLYFGANDHHFYAVDRKTGKKLWSFKTSHPLVITTPVVHGDTVYMAQWVDWVYALDAATGKMKWRDCVPISIEKLHFYRDRLYLRSARQIAEYDPATGRRLRLANAVYGYNGVAFLNNLVLSTGIGSATAVNLDDRGEPSRHQDQPALRDVLILKSTGIAAWPRLASMGTPLVIGDLVCFASRKGEVLLIQPEPGTVQDRVVRQKTVWSTQLGDTCHASPIFADGCLLVGCDDGKLYAFRAK